MYTSPTAWLDHSAVTRGDSLAVADAEESLDYRLLRRDAGAVAAGLADAGVGPGDLVAIDAPLGVPHAVAVHGAILSGALVQSVPRHRGEATAVPEDAYLLDAELIAALRELSASWEAQPRDSREPLTRVMSSGTTGEPKAVDLSAANHLWSALGSGVNLGVGTNDRWLGCLPLNHVGGLTILIRSCIYGTGVLMQDGFDVDRVAAVMEEGEVSIVSLVPTQLVRLLDARAPVDRPRLLLLGGGSASEDLICEGLDAGAVVVQTYGLTEACSQVCTVPPDRARELAGSAGRPLLGVELRIADGEGEEEVGEIQVRGPIVADGAADGDGWLHTGDLGRVDADGCLWVEGRRVDLIVTGGENVRPLRVERVLSAFDGVADVAVIGREDREWGQAVTALVVPADGEVDEATLLSHAREHLAPHEVPKAVETVGELPRTPSGKLLRRELG